MGKVIELLIATIFGYLLNITVEHIRTHKKAHWPTVVACFLLVFIYAAYLGIYPKIEIDAKTRPLIPGKVSIYVDGKHVGYDHKVYQVPRGSHQIRLTFEGSKESFYYEEIMQEVQTKLFGTTTIQEFLDREVGKLDIAIKSSSDIVAVTIYGPDNYQKTLKKRPFSFDNIPAGFYFIEVECKKGNNIEHEFVPNDLVVLGGMQRKSQIIL